MHRYELLEILAVGFSLALLFGYAAKRLGLSPIVGYLIAGFIIGPYSPGFEADMNLAHELSEAGVILLMFGVGLHFDIKDLLAVKGVAVPGALVQCTVATILGTWVATWFGFDWSHGLVLGLGLSVASTVVLLRVLEDNGVVDTVHGHVSVGWLVVEDLITVMVLVLMPSYATAVAGGGGGLGTVAQAVGLALLRIAALYVLVMVVGGKVVPWVLTKIVRTRSQELFTLAVLVAAFATAVAAAVFFGASMALGAFLGGMVVGRTKVSHQAGADVLPFRDAFAVLFFVSVGMLFDPAFLLEQPWLILCSLLIVLIAKPLTALIVVCVLGWSTTTAFTVAVALSQIGEFSFILAQLGVQLELVPQEVYSVLVVCAIVSISINPALFKRVPKMEAALERHPRLWHLMSTRSERRARQQNEAVAQSPEAMEAVGGAIEEARFTAIVVGYGPAGKSVVQSLKQRGVMPVVIDLNVDTVNYLNDEKKIPAVFGDSAKKEVLRGAGIDKASYLIITLPDIGRTTATALAAEELNPQIRVLARARFLNDGKLLQQVGVNGIAFEEEEVALALAQLLEKDLADCAAGTTTCTIDFDALEGADLSEQRQEESYCNKE